MKYEEGELELKVPSVSRKKRKKDNEIVLSDYRNSIANAGLPSFEKIPLAKSLSEMKTSGLS